MKLYFSDKTFSDLHIYVSVINFKQQFRKFKPKEYNSFHSTLFTEVCH